jgi:hypothetical protein
VAGRTGDIILTGLRAAGEFVFDVVEAVYRGLSSNGTDDARDE